MKKIPLIVLFLLTLAFTIFIIFDKNKTFNDYLVNKKEWNSIIDGKSSVEDDILKNIKFNGYELLYDKETYTYYYSLVDGNNLYNPTVQYSTTGRYKIAFLNKINEKLIKNDGTVNIVVYNDNSYRIYNLKCTTLPLVSIDSSEEIGMEDVDISFYLFDNRKDASKRIITSSGNMHIRGGSSKAFPKKNYKLKLNKQSPGKNNRPNNISLLGMRMDNDWILYSAYNDQEKIRNIFASNLWYQISSNNSLGISNGYEFRYVELFLNGKHYGLYGLGYKVDKKTQGISKNNTNEAMFKKRNWKNDLDISGPFTLENEVEDTDKAWELLRNYYNTLENAKSKEEIYNMLDMDNIVDMYIFMQFVVGIDNFGGTGQKNLYITFKEKDNKMVAIYTPWDLDETFGNGWSTSCLNNINEYGISPDYDYIMDIFPIAFIQKLDPSIDKVISKRYKELRNSILNDNTMNNLIDEYEKIIFDSGAYSRDIDLWPNTNKNTDIDKLDKFRNWIMERLDYLDNKFEK